MASWKTVAYLSFVIFGVITFIDETDAEKRRKTKLEFNPPRIRDYFDIRNEWIEKPGWSKGDKKKKLRTELIAAGNKLTVNVPNPPVILHQVLEYWPYNRIYVTSIIGIFRYIRNLMRIAYRIVWIFIDMAILIVKIIFQATEVGKLKVSYDLLNKPHGVHPHGLHQYGHNQHAQVIYDPHEHHDHDYY